MQWLKNCGKVSGALMRESGAQTACRWGWDADFCMLASCKASRLPSYRSGGYPIDAVRYEIDAVYQNELLHIVLGDESFAYQSAPWLHMIRNGEEMTAGMDALTGTDTTKQQEG